MDNNDGKINEDVDILLEEPLRRRKSPRNRPFTKIRNLKEITTLRKEFKIMKTQIELLEHDFDQLKNKRSHAPQKQHQEENELEKL